MHTETGTQTRTHMYWFINVTWSIKWNTFDTWSPLFACHLANVSHSYCCLLCSVAAVDPQSWHEFSIYVNIKQKRLNSHTSEQFDSVGIIVSHAKLFCIFFFWTLLCPFGLLVLLSKRVLVVPFYYHNNELVWLSFHFYRTRSKWVYLVCCIFNWKVC